MEKCPSTYQIYDSFHYLDTYKCYQKSLLSRECLVFYILSKVGLIYYDLTMSNIKGKNRENELAISFSVVWKFSSKWLNLT